MKALVYRIDRSWLGKVGRKFKTPDLPPATGALILGRVFQTVRDVRTDDVFILNEDKEIGRFRDPRGLSLQEGIYYLRNPAKLYTADLIPASEFHPYIIRQQTAEMIDYLRANTNATRIKVEINRSTTVGVNADILIPPSQSTPPLGLNGNVEYKKIGQHVTELIFKSALKRSEGRKQFGWIESFPHLMAAVDEIEGEGKIRISESYDMSFGLNAKLADFIGVSAQWLDKHSWSLEVETAK